MAITTTVPLFIPQGATYIHTFYYVDDNDDAIDLTGFDARMQIRESLDDDTVQFDGSTDTGEIEITPAEGKVEVTIEEATTEGFDFTRGVYDLEIIDSTGRVTRLAKGPVQVDPEVTRENV